MPTTLPEWPRPTIAVLATIDEAPHAIPVSTPVRAGDQAILLSLHRSRDSLARLRERPHVALLFLAEGNVAFTARGTARVVEEEMTDWPDYAAVEVAVSDVDDHRQDTFTVEAGIDRKWIDEDEKRALGERVNSLQQLAVNRDPVSDRESDKEIPMTSGIKTVMYPG
jgi:Pyridoxamine 5'-phosphate oxidase